MILVRVPEAKGDSVRISANLLSPQAVRVELHDLNPREVMDARRDPTLLGAVRPMPVKLIRPLAAASSLPAGGVPAVSWGIEAVGADRSPYNGAGSVVAVLDTGIDAGFANRQAFQGVAIQCRNFTNEADEDQDGHGTHCAGTIFGGEVEGCRIGVAPGVTKALIAKVIGDSQGTTYPVFSAMLWALQGSAHVISMSLGIDFHKYTEQLAEDHPQEVALSLALSAYRDSLRLFDRLSQLSNLSGSLVQGTVVVAAAGNESRRDVDAEYRVQVALPAAAESVVSVAALGRVGGPTAGVPVRPDELDVAPFSNVGARLAAPGMDILSAKLGGGLVGMSGTSMATPHVAGTTLLWIERLLRQGVPISPARVILELERSVIPLPHLGPDDVGLGLVQAPEN